MKHLKRLLIILILLPFLSYGQNSNNSTVSDLLDYINTEVGKYNKYEANFSVEGKFLVFGNKFGEARIPFSKIGFRMDEKTYSIDIFCLDNKKCINMYNEDGKLSTWAYYNVSMPDGDEMAESGYTVFNKFKKLKGIVLGEIIVDTESSAALLFYINRQFSKYNKYNTQFDIDKEANKLIFTNQFGIARIRFADIGFKLNKKTKSIDVYCLDGSKCIDKYDDSGELSTWNYYNVSMPDGDEMASEIYTVLTKCKKLKRSILGTTQNDDVVHYDDDNNEEVIDVVVDDGLSIDDLLNYINSEIRKYNKYGSRLSVDGDKLIFMNNFGRADISFRSIDFRIDEEHNSIDIYCIDGSKCIDKYDNSEELTNWDYYNISMPDGDGMASSAVTVLERCKALKKKALR
jgi:hypothetical protein